jgi:hypothetical protein
MHGGAPAYPRWQRKELKMSASYEDCIHRCGNVVASVRGDHRRFSKLLSLSIFDAGTNVECARMSNVTTGLGAVMLIPNPRPIPFNHECHV